MFSKIVVSLDGSEQSMAGLRYAQQLAADQSAHIEVVHVREVLVGRAVGGQPANLQETEIVKQIETAVHGLSDAGFDVHLQVVSTVHGGPARIIADVASGLRADVIVIGTRGHGAAAGSCWARSLSACFTCRPARSSQSRSMSRQGSDDRE